MHYVTQRRRAIFLLLSIVLFLLMAPLLEGNTRGELILVLNMYATLIASTLELKEKPLLFWSALPIAGTSMILMLAAHFHPARHLLIASDSVLVAFFALVCVSLFEYLGRKGRITSERLYVSVSLYFLLGLCWFSIYNLVSALQPGSFAESGTAIHGRPNPSQMLYFSIATLTTLGYGDIVAVRPGARMVATLEAAAGVLYIAITVARLVAAYQVSSADETLKTAN